MNIPDAPAARPPALPYLLSGALGAFLFTLLNRYVGEWVPIPSAGTVFGHLVSLVYLAFLLFFLICLARGAALSQRSTGFLVVVGVAFALPMGTVLASSYWRYQPPLYLFLTANNLFLPLGAVLVGAAIGRIIRHPNTLLAGAAVAIFFDVVVVTMGTVAQLLQSNSKLIAAVSVGAGPSAPASPLVKSIPLLSGVTIGPADVLFLALFLASVAQMPRLKPEWNLSLTRTVGWMYGLLFLALVLVELFGLPVPALVPMGVAVLIANGRHAAFSRQEKRDLWIGAAFALCCAVGIVAYGKFFAAKAAQAAPPQPETRMKWGWSLGVVRETQERFVTSIYPGYPAATVGIRPGDVIESLNGVKTTELTTQEALMRVLGEAEAKGLTVRLRRLGEKKPLEFKVILP